VIHRGQARARAAWWARSRLARRVLAFSKSDGLDVPAAHTADRTSGATSSTRRLPAARSDLAVMARSTDEVSLSHFDKLRPVVLFYGTRVPVAGHDRCLGAGSIRNGSVPIRCGDLDLHGGCRIDPPLRAAGLRDPLAQRSGFIMNGGRATLASVAPRSTQRADGVSRTAAGGGNAFPSSPLAAAVRRGGDA